MNNELIARARRRYLAANPLRVTDVPNFMSIPNIGDIQVIGCKLGMEYLAICHDDEAVEEWIHTAMEIVKDPELLGILLANVFRGVNVVIGSMLSNNGLREQMEKMALEAWTRDFSDTENWATS